MFRDDNDPADGPEDLLLKRALSSLYPERSSSQGSAVVKGWSAIESEVLRLAARRRRRHRLREFFFGIRPVHLVLYAGVAALLLLVPRLLPDPRHEQVALVPFAPPKVSAAHAALGPGTSGQALLLSGAQLRLQGGDAEIDQVKSNQPRIVLRSGVLSVKVPRLGTAGKLVVATEEAEVIVHGTQFAVSKLRADTTSVLVHEGLVEVRPIGGQRPAVFLRAGQHVDVPAAGRYLAAVTKRAGELIARSTCDDPDHGLDTYLKIAPPEEDRSAALYLVAYCAAQRGDKAQALAVFEQVAATSNNPTRADNALARVAQIRAEGSRTEGMQAWRRYLERFPAGLNRESAHDFLAGENLP